MPRHKLLLSGTSDLMKRKNEIWYLRRLRIVSEDLKQTITGDIKAIAEQADKQEGEPTPGDRAMLAHKVDGTIRAAQQSFTMPINPKRTSQAAAALNLHSTDVWWVGQMRSALVLVRPADLAQPRLYDAAPKKLTKAQLEALRKKRQQAQLGLRPGAVRPLSTLSIIRGQAEIEAAFKLSVDANIALINSIEPQYYSRMREILFQHIETAARWETLADKLREGIAQVNNLVDYRVNLIARDQTAKMAAAFNEARSASVGITQYTWQTNPPRQRRQAVQLRRPTGRDRQPRARRELPLRGAAVHRRGRRAGGCCVMTTVYKLLTPEQRAAILRRMKHGPKLGKRKNRLVDYTRATYRDVTGKDLKGGAA